MKNVLRRAVLALIPLSLFVAVSGVTAKPLSCTSGSRMVSAVTDPVTFPITTRYQFDTPNLQPLLRYTISANRGCLVAHLSGLARITDNYVVFQVRVDGVPMKGHLPGVAGVATPVVFASIDSLSAAPLNDEQFIDPTKVTAYNFFDEIGEGIHTIEVLGAAGSGVDMANPSQVSNLVLTLEYQ
ncbi:hypothetical protein [Tahibacter amnicola]|uniref:Type 1 fimbria pilin n=1 Tax=Tahibacter amnicola TaxID=2976241 RepID=A0ABY6BJQ8_9GAMM|nr:hypothetical protein [Tahibacter amnicola]UXI70124.1 hypothetical protein N4264_10985 [Tahibacter amnicola]